MNKRALRGRDADRDNDTEPWTETLRVGSEALVVTSFAVVSPPAAQRLTAAEREVVALVLRGESNERIARARGTTTRTVSKQLTSIYEKLGVASRHEVASAFFNPVEDDQ